MLVRLSLKYSLGARLKRSMKPNSQIRVDEPTRQPRSDHHARPQRSPHQVQVGKKIVDWASRCFLLDRFERQIEISCEIPKCVVNHVKFQSCSDVVGSGGIPT